MKKKLNWKDTGKEYKGETVYSPDGGSTIGSLKKKKPLGYMGDVLP